MKHNYDFGGWATKNNLKCADGRTIMPDAFKDNDGQTVPLVYQHLHNSLTNVLGHALLENRPEGVYAYLKFNETRQGQDAKIAVKHKDLTYLSIYANGLIEKSRNVTHGVIREVSLVLAGANPGAVIDNVYGLQHSDDGDVETPIEDEVVIRMHIPISVDKEESKEESNEEDLSHADTPADGEETVQDVFDTLTDKQKTAVYALLAATEGDTATHSDEDEGDEHAMKHNVFSDNASDGDNNKKKQNPLLGSSSALFLTTGNRPALSNRLSWPTVRNLVSTRANYSTPEITESTISGICSPTPNL